MNVEEVYEAFNVPESLRKEINNNKHFICIAGESIKISTDFLKALHEPDESKVQKYLEGTRKHMPPGQNF